MDRKLSIPKSIPGLKYTWCPVRKDSIYNKVFYSIEECIADATDKFNDDVHNSEHFPVINCSTSSNGEIDPYINIGVVWELDIEKLKHDVSKYCFDWVKLNKPLEELPEHFVCYIEDAISTEMNVEDDKQIIECENKHLVNMVEQLSKLKSPKILKIQKIVDSFIGDININVTEAAVTFDPVFNVKDQNWYNWKTLERLT